LFEAYLYAQHAQERNAYILEKTSQEIDKMTPNEVGSGMTDAEADAIINWFDTYANKTQVEVINGQVRQVIADTNDVRQKGQLSPIFDEDDAPWKSYVPLKGSLDPDDETAELSNRPVQVNKQIKGLREDRRLILWAIFFNKTLRLFYEPKETRLAYLCLIFCKQMIQILSQRQTLI
jgi:hypothetical protein